MIDAAAARKAQARMESRRSNVESRWAEIGPLLLDSQAQFQGNYSTEGQDRTDRRFDSYPAQALEDGVAGFLGFVMPKGERWQKLAIANDRLMAMTEVRQWLESVENRLFAHRNDPDSGFAIAMDISVASLLAFGNQCMWVDIRYDPMGRAQGLSYQAEHIGGVFYELDAEGRPMRVHRKFMLTAEQAMFKWGDASPPCVQKAMTGKNPEPAREFTFVHVIERNSAMVPGRMDKAGKPWIGGYYCEGDGDGADIFADGGYRVMKRIVSPFRRAANEFYGTCPAMTVLPEIRACQIMKQDRVIAVEQRVKPPWLATDDALDRGTLNIGPNGITFGGLDERGEPVIKPLYDGSGDLGEATALHMEEREHIDRAFYRHLFQMYREDKTHITATKTMEQVAEKGILLGPLAMQEGAWLTPMLAAELDLMDQLGDLDDMPPVLEDYFAAEGGFAVKYDNLVNQMGEASGAVGFFRTAEQIAGLAQIDPEFVAHFKRSYDPDQVVPWLGRLNGIPARLERSDAGKAEFDDAKQQEAQLQQLLAAAPVLTQSAANAAQAETALG